MLDFFFSDDVRRNPFPWYDELRCRSPVLGDPRSGAWMLFSYAAVKQAMDDHETFSSRAVPPGGRAPEWLVFLDPPRHTRLRAIVTRAFTPRTVAALEPRVREISRGLLDRVARRGEMDLVGDFAGPLPVLVIAEMIGIPAADHERFARWSEVIMRLAYSAAGGEDAARAVREHAEAKEEMRACVAGLTARRRAAPRDDLLTRLVGAEVDGERLTEEEILGFFQLLLAAATETTTNLISSAVLCVLEHPREMDRLRAAPELLPRAIEEVARYRSPGQIAFRQTTRDVEMHGAVIPADSLVLAMVGSANRDPDAFADAARFDVARDPNPHLAFGHGIHYCIGAALARLEARVALPDLLERLPGLALAADEPWQPRRAPHVHGPQRLPVRFRAASTSATAA